MTRVECVSVSFRIVISNVREKSVTITDFSSLRFPRSDTGGVCFCVIPSERKESSDPYNVVTLLNVQVLLLKVHSLPFTVPLPAPIVKSTLLWKLLSMNPCDIF